MPAFDKEKVYLLQVLGKGMRILIDALIPGDKIGQVAEAYQHHFPAYKMILVFDAETKDSVCVIRP